VAGKIGGEALVRNQRSAMDVFQFLIIPQYVLGGVLVPLHGVPGYMQVVSTSPVLDAVVIAGVFGWR
jgi:hypothetical protein